MGINISCINNTTLKQLARQYDNGDEILDRKEFINILAVIPNYNENLNDNAISELKLMDYNLDNSNWLSKFRRDDFSANMFRKMNLNSVADWLDGSNNKCTDGKDDGHISFTEGLKSFGIGLAGILKGAINNPAKTAFIVGTCSFATLATSGAILPALVTLGMGLGISQIGKSIYKIATANNDTEAKTAWEGIGTGTSMTFLSMLGAKNSLEYASKSGVTSANNYENMNMFQASMQNIKSTPEAFKVCKLNLTSNLNALKAGNVNFAVNPFKKADFRINNTRFYKFISAKSRMISLQSSQLYKLSMLNPQKTYIGLLYSDDYIADAIKVFSKQYCQDNNVPIHAFSLVNEDGEWWIYESMPNEGVYKRKANEWITSNEDLSLRFDLYEAPINKNKLDEYLGEKYSFDELFSLIDAYINDSNGNQKDEPGFICSEYIAKCFDDICKYYNLPPWCITPAHIKQYFVEQQIKPATIN